MIDELERIRKKAVMDLSRHHLNIYLEGVNKIMKNFSQ
jgi:hypothetical protein